jgi:hypothetical protein
MSAAARNCGLGAGLNYHIARDERLENAVVTEIVRYNLQRQSHPVAAEQVKQGCVRKLCILAN